ncbi:hypothetical protein GJAV_G00239950 [Gymnothorax javanicus]|nr:hypothetical protein GJAV_G00239950 [Gymnothorax javanicus]
MDGDCIKAILFDLDNTLIDTAGAGRIANQKVEEVLRSSFENGDIQKIIQGFEQRLLQEKSGDTPIDQQTRMSQLAIPGPVRDLLKDLWKNYKLLLLTNGVAQVQWEKVKAVHCEELFHAVVVGGDHAEEKPALSIFQHCFSLLKVEPQDCIMVGDSLHTDILGGVNAGVRATVWVNDKGTDIPPTVSVKPDYTVTTVLELPNILSKLEVKKKN